jgi:hypothetical protein
LKTANELVMEIGVAVQPPRGVAIVLTEEPGALPNWVAAAGIMEAALTDKFSEIQTPPKEPGTWPNPSSDLRVIEPVGGKGQSEFNAKAGGVL